ncbi:transcriptional regulator [Alteraurantiacibacter palmitatis]|uniref:YdaS family helix-turn-helix protein n=1 Tax=Alteraurantiacibacter palmitatis TaxID=2054628 RepID=A0ABV7E706_9SPHN
MEQTPAQFDSPQAAFAAAAKRIEGGQTALGRLCGKTQGAVSKRLSGGQPIWGDLGLAVFAQIEAATGVSRHDLRPDIYPREEAAASADVAGLEGIAA